METGKLQLVFGPDGKIKFGNEGEFFEMLGILCRKDGHTGIKGNKKANGFAFFHSDTGYRVKDSGQPMTAEEERSGAQSMLASSKFYSGEVYGTFKIACSPSVEYPCAFALNESNEASCTEYAEYLMAHFGAKERCAKPQEGKLGKAVFEIPDAAEMRKIIADAGYGAHLDSFEKGYGRQPREPKG